MEKLQRRLGPQPANRLRSFLLDANDIPFCENSFDCVVGHSVLHHLAQFENTIAECFRVTRPGGVCVFGEPVMDIHVYAALAASLILKLEEAKAPQTGGRRKALNALTNRPKVKRANLDGDRSKLADIEDKFVFPIDYMRALGDRIGFSHFDCISRAGRSTLGNSARSLIERTCEKLGENTDFLDDYDFLFDSLTQTLGAPMKINGLTPFSYFVFVK